MSEWKTMDGAPTDGTPVDMWVKNRDHAFRITNAEYRSYRSDRDNEGWYDNEGDRLDDLGWWPQFWMPIPAPPSTTPD